MPFDTHLVAFAWQKGRYSIASQFMGFVNEKKLKDAGRLVAVPISPPGSRDFAAILSRCEFPEVVWPNSPVAAWLANLQEEVCFIMVHLAEWESGPAD